MLKASLLGNIGAEPELRYSANGDPFLRFNVAANVRTRTPDGAWQDRTEWVRVTITGQRAESLSQYLRKGSRVYVDGRLEARPWTTREGELRAGLEVMANEVEFASPRSDGQEAAQAAPGATSVARPMATATAGVSGRQEPGSAVHEPAAQRVLDDETDLEDLPF